MLLLYISVEATASVAEEVSASSQQIASSTSSIGELPKNMMRVMEQFKI